MGKLKLKIIDGKPRPEPKDSELHRSTYLFWRETWQNVFSSVGSASSFNPDNFFRQSFVVVLYIQEEEKTDIVGMLSGTEFDLHHSVSFDHSYLSTLPEELKHFLGQSRAKACASAEYLCVSPKYRRLSKDLGFSLAESLICFHMLEAARRGVDVIIGTGVIEKGVDRMCHRFGYKDLKRVQRLGLDCSLMTNSLCDFRLPAHLGFLNFVSGMWSGSNSIEPFMPNENSNKVLKIAA